MTTEEDTLELEASKHRIHRYRYLPDGNRIGGLVMVHGLGDYLGRYEHIAKLFCDRGFECTGVDLPGHGRSSGSRGHIPSIETITDLVDTALFEFSTALPNGAPIGIFAHSMGGFAMIEEIKNRQQLLNFAWLSSPLVSPSDGQKPLKVFAAKSVGWLLPWLPFNTGVSSEACRPADVPRDPLLHNRVSAAFGGELMNQESIVQEAALEINSELSLLVTHGTEDRVCSPKLSHELFDSIPLRDKRYIDVEGALHEPLHGPQTDWVLEQVATWLDDQIRPSSMS
ncbi:MAG: alpha/beta fold hydrolase [Verrucomicrobiota bacterium]